MSEREEASQSWSEHDCYAWQNSVWHNSKDARWQTCAVCGQVLNFSFRNFWCRVLLIWRTV